MPVPKAPVPETTKQLRKISSTLNFSKLLEGILCDAMVSDMAPSRDPSQYANQKKVSIQHYLIKLLDKILTAVDRNNQHEAYAVILQMIDWSQAYDRQCPKMAIQSFIKNGVRKSLIPVLINYFQDREMAVKWQQELSSVRKLPGGGPQGCRMGQESYCSQTNNNADCVSPDNRFKWIDDLSLIEIINLISIGLTS